MSAVESFDQEFKEPPHNIEVEQALIGAVFINNDAWNSVAGVVTSQQFYDPLHMRIWEVIARQMGEGLRVSPLTLKSVFDGEDITGSVTVPQYLGTLAANATTVINAPSYARTVAELARLRDLMAAVEAFCGEIADAGADMTESCAGLISELDAVLAGTGRKTTRCSVGQAASRAVESLTSEEEPQAVSTGLADLDRALGGYYRGEYVLMAGRPGMGKTATALSTLLRAAMRGQGVLYFSLEMTAAQLSCRCLTDLAYNQHTPIAYSDIRKRAVDMVDHQRLEDARDRLMQAELEIEEKSNLTMAEIGARARAHAQAMERRGKRLDVVVIDHLGKIKPSGRYSGNRVNEVTEISSALATLAKDLDCAVIALSQLNRGIEAKDRVSRRPTLADLRDSGALEQDADVVIFLYRAAYYLERMKFDGADDASRAKEEKRLDDLEAKKHDLEIIIAKQRSGETRTLKAWCDMGANVVRDRL